MTQSVAGIKSFAVVDTVFVRMEVHKVCPLIHYGMFVVVDIVYTGSAGISPSLKFPH